MPRARRQPQPGRRPDARRNHVPLVRTRPHAAAVRHGPAHCRRKQEGATQLPTIGLFERGTRTILKEPETRRLKNRGHLAIAVGTPITGRPPHRTVRAAFLHTAPTWDV